MNKNKQNIEIQYIVYGGVSMMNLDVAYLSVISLHIVSLCIVSYTSLCIVSLRAYPS